MAGFRGSGFKIVLLGITILLMEFLAVRIVILAFSVAMLTKDFVEKVKRPMGTSVREGCPSGEKVQQKKCPPCDCLL